MAVIDVDARDLARKMMLWVRIKRARTWTVRLWVAMVLVRVAAWIAWMDVKFEVKQ